MHSRKCKFVIIFSVILMIAMFSQFLNKTIQIPTSSHSYTDPPFVIDSDADFIAIGFSGSGNVSSPYVISDYIIDVSGYGILVQGTTKHFIIQNCTIYTDYIGIRIDNVAAGTAIIQNNTCIAKSYDGGGIAASGNGILIWNNTCRNFAQGVHTNQASNIQIYNNSIYNSTYQGINIRHTSNSVICGNWIKDCREYAIAIVLSLSSGNRVHSNFVEGNTYADEVNVDGIDRGKPNSQAFDEGNNNTWESNCWSDYKGKGDYCIDGPADSVDSNPVNCFNNRVISGFLGIGLISLTIVVAIVLYSNTRRSK